MQSGICYFFLRYDLLLGCWSETNLLKWRDDTPMLNKKTRLCSILMALTDENTLWGIWTNTHLHTPNILDKIWIENWDFSYIMHFPGWYLENGSPRKYAFAVPWWTIWILVDLNTTDDTQDMTHWHIHFIPTWPGRLLNVKPWRNSD